MSGDAEIIKTCRLLPFVSFSKVSRDTIGCPLSEVKAICCQWKQYVES